MAKRATPRTGTPSSRRTIKELTSLVAPPERPIDNDPRVWPKVQGELEQRTRDALSEAETFLAQGNISAAQVNYRRYAGFASGRPQYEAGTLAAGLLGQYSSNFSDRPAADPVSLLALADRLEAKGSPDGARLRAFAKTGQLPG